MNYLYTQYKHYIKYINENGTDRIYKGLKILPISNKFSGLSNFKINEEIFEKPIECVYEINYINSNQIKITFKSKSNVEYRLDLFKIIEDGVLYNHISYTKNDDIFDKNPENQQEQDEIDMRYEEPTNNYEVYDLLGRIRFILNSMVNDKVIENSFCVGGTLFLKKNYLYKYFLKMIVGEDGFKKRDTVVYPKVGWGLYFKI
jgi:hypothetical protein